MKKDFKEKLVETIEKQYGFEVRTDTHNRLVTDAWDSIQRKVTIRDITSCLQIKQL